VAASISRAQRTTCFDPTVAPALEVPAGTTVRVETDDSAYERLASGESLESIGLERLNAVTGPIAIAGAEPGDALRIDILSIEITRAWAAWLPGFGPLGDRVAAPRVRQLRMDGAFIGVAEWLRVPLQPSIGCIGLAPAVGIASTLRPTYTFGGNMDLRELSAGATLWLPVQTPGALLSLGDLHAAMGEGEAAHVSIEAAGAATIRIDVEKGRLLAAPRVRTGSDTICIGMDDRGRRHGGIAAAYNRAVQQAYEYLTGECGFDAFEAYAYVCARVSTRFGGPAGSLVLAVIPDHDPVS
jgi:amidase